MIVGLLHLEKKTLPEIRALVAECEKRAEGAVGHTAGVDYYCWDLYARTSQWYEQGSEEENAARKKLRYATLHELEQGGNETSEIAELISTAVLRRHLETMLRLDIEYDFSAPVRERDSAPQVLGSSLRATQADWRSLL